VRTADATPARVATHPESGPAWQRWRLVIALERLPQAAYVWDDEDPDVTWDDATPARVWDAPFIGSGFTDAFCDYTGVQITHGEPDEHELYRSGECVLTVVDPGDGRYRARTADGRLVYFAAGREVQVYAIDPGGVAWWLFRGRISTWHDPMDNTGQVVITAQTGSAELAQDPGRDWQVGAATDQPSVRAGKVLTQWSYTRPSRFDLGDVTLAVPAVAKDSPWEVLQRAYWSDGGIVYSDADDTLVGRDRRWRNGRSDQPAPPRLFTDNVCDVYGAVGISDFTGADEDDWLAGQVLLQNAATPTPLVATATIPPGSTLSAAQRFTHPDTDLWQTQAAGDTLAAFILAARSQPRLAVGNATVALHDPRTTDTDWLAMIDLRLGDRVSVWHQDTFAEGVPTDVFLDVVVQTIRHDITPEAWSTSFESSPAVGYTQLELWDRTRFPWDDPDPLAVWR
jgi:hypothetical protein